MAAASLLALIDDIASLLDDVATMTKVATKKTAGVLGDDLALNAQQVSGVQAERELAVVWAVAKGSLRNKAILVPAALAISAVAPWAIAPLLMAGGLFLVFEGAEKLVHRRAAHGAGSGARDAPGSDVAPPPAVAGTAASPDRAAAERAKIAGAVRTDFVLSAEIVVIALGTVAAAPIGVRVAVLVGLGLLMTAGVYGLVAAIVKLDDLGLALLGRGGAAGAVGRGLLAAAPWLMRGLSVAGTVAMFVVGGGILVHGVPPLHHAIASLAEHAAPLGGLVEAASNAVAGGLAGLAAVAAVAFARRGLHGR